MEKKVIRYDKDGNEIKKGNKYRIQFFPTVDVHHVENWKRYNVAEDDFFFGDKACCKLCRVF